MKTSTMHCRDVLVCAAFVAASGCSWPPAAPSVALPSTAQGVFQGASNSWSIANVPPRPMGGTAAPTWMAADARSKDLLYVSNCCWVSVYSYPQGKLEGKLTGFGTAAGQCVDDKGDVYITNLVPSRVYEYAHGGTRRIKTLEDPIDPVGCAIDPTTGNLAVTSLGDGGGEYARVAIFPKGSGSPTYYTDSAFQEYFFCAYDSAGDLFIQGNSAPGSGHVVFAELPKGGSTLKNITLPQYIGWPGGLRWDGKFLVVGDQVTPTIYRFTISGSSGTLAGTTNLGSGAKDVTDFFIQNHTIIAPNQCAPCQHTDALFFRYPAGGTATKILMDGIKGPDGASVSLASE